MANRLMKRCSSVIWGNQITWKSNHKKILSHICQNCDYQKTRNNQCWQECEEKGALVPCGWDCKLLESLWKTVWRFLKNSNNNNNNKKQCLNTITLPSGSSSLGYGLGKNTKNMCAPPVHCSIIYSSQNMAARSLID